MAGDMKDQEKGLATNGSKGAEKESPKDAQPTQFSYEQHQKTPGTIEAL